MLSFNDVTFAYPNQRPILEHLHFSISKNSRAIFLGPSGCGKSTIFRLLNALETPQAGSITLDEQPPGHAGGISFMPQKDLLLPWKNLLENIALPLEIQGMKREARLKRAESLLQRVGLSSYAHAYPDDLSGGMRQRVSFARALITGAHTLLLDEPFSALDAITRLEMQDWLYTQWLEEPCTMLLITHDVEEALRLGTDVYLIEERPIRHMRHFTVPVAEQKEAPPSSRTIDRALRDEILHRLLGAKHRIKQDDFLSEGTHEN